IRAAQEVEALRPVPPPFDVLEQRLARDVTSRWRVPCEAAFEFILKADPSQLAKLITSMRLAPADLTFATEILGYAEDGELVRSTLRPLLSSEEAFVREGVIYGLGRHMDVALRAELEQLRTSDPSRAVQTAAREALDEL